MHYVIKFKNGSYYDPDQATGMSIRLSDALRFTEYSHAIDEIASLERDFIDDNKPRVRGIRKVAPKPVAWAALSAFGEVIELLKTESMAQEAMKMADVSQVVPLVRMKVKKS